MDSAASVGGQQDDRGNHRQTAEYIGGGPMRDTIIGATVGGGVGNWHRADGGFLASAPNTDLRGCMASRKSRLIDWETLLAGISRRKSPVKYSADCEIFRQGQPADSLLYLRRGKVGLTVISRHGKKAIVAVRRAGEFFGEGCLADQPLRMETATAMTMCTLDKLEKLLVTRLLHERHEISELFIAHLLSRNIRYEADLVNQFFNSSENRLARILLQLSRFGKKDRAELLSPGISQADLARMVGTTRSRVSHFLNKFRELGFIDYGAKGGLIVQSGLLSVVLHD